MNVLQIFSILVLIAGLVIFFIGLTIYAVLNPAPEWCSLVIMIGMLFVLGAIVLVITSIDYDKAVRKDLTL